MRCKAPLYCRPDSPRTHLSRQARVSLKIAESTRVCGIGCPAYLAGPSAAPSRPCETSRCASYMRANIQTRDHRRGLRVAAEEFLADEGAVARLEGLVVAVHALLHQLAEPAAGAPSLEGPFLLIWSSLSA